MMKRKEIFSIILEEIHQNFPDVKGIYLFGSYACEKETEQSDLDIAVLLDKPANVIMLYKTAEEIAYRIKKDVDLIDLRSVPTVFQFQIISSATRIDTMDFEACDSFEDLSYSMYIRFNEERKSILDEIEKRGKIYNG